MFHAAVLRRGFHDSDFLNFVSFVFFAVKISSVPSGRKIRIRLSFQVAVRTSTRRETAVLTKEDIKGVAAMVPTPCKEDGEGWDATDSVDLDETARMIENYIRDGIGVI